MIRRIGILAGALVLLAMTQVSAQQVATGRVARVDQAGGMVVLDNGQMYQASPSTVFFVNGQPANWATLAPGTPVVVQNGQQVMYPDARYVAVTPQPEAGPNTPYEISGVVRWVGPTSLTLDDGRHIWIDERTHVTTGGSPAMLSTLRPGSFVVIRSTQPMALRKTAPMTYVPVTPATTPAPIVGTVARFDQPNFIVLTDGRMIPTNANTLVFVNNQSVPMAMLQPGTPVMIYQNGQGAEYPYAMPAPIQQR